MKGFTLTRWNGETADCSPCVFCKHRQKANGEYPCCFCISDEDSDRPCAEAEFTEYEPRSRAHLEVLMLEQEEANEKKQE